MKQLWQRGRNYLQVHGAGYTVRRSLEKLGERVFHPCDKAWRRMQPTAAELQHQREHTPDAGLISIVIPVYNTKPALLRELAESLTAQTYPRWQACLYDGMSTKPETIAALDEIAGNDARIIVRHGEANEGIAGNSNLALDMAEGAWIALCDHDDLLTPDALWRVAQVIVADQPDVIYSDEDKVTEDGRYHTDPNFKPDFSPDDLRSGNYVCHLLVMRAALLREIGGFRMGFDGSQDHDLTLRLAEHTEKIAHIPYVLYHWRTVGSSASHQNLMRCVDAGCRAVQDHMNRIGLPGTAEPNGDCIRLRYDVAEDAAVRVIVSGRGCAAHLREEMGQAWPHLNWTVLEDSSCAALNRAAMEAGEDVLLFVDASARVQTAEFVRELLMYAQREDVGAAVPLLTTRWGRRLQSSAVITQGVKRARQSGMPRWVNGWGRLMRISHNVPTVNGECVMIRRDHFVPLVEGRGGLPDWLKWSETLASKGLRHVCTPFARAALGRLL